MGQNPMPTTLEPSLGNKIRNFRLRAGFSQMQLETEINASSGSISRIENGEVNPTKETLIKISQTLSLTDFETLDLFSIRLKSIIDLLELIVDLNSEIDAKTMLQKAADGIANIMGYRNVTVLLIKDNKLSLSTMNNNSDSTNAVYIAGDNYEEMTISCDDPTLNYSLAAAIEGKVVENNYLPNFVNGWLAPQLAVKIQKVTQIKNCIVLPLKIEDYKIGTLFIAKTTPDSFHDELKILDLIARYLSLTIKNNLLLSKIYGYKPRK